MLGFFGGMALSLIFAVTAIALGAAKGTVPVLLAGQAGLWLGLAMAAYAVSHRRPGGSLRDLGFFTPSLGELGMGVGFAFIALFGEARLVAILRALFPNDNSGISSNVFVHQPSAAAIVVTALLVCLGAPIFEELFFRGVVQGILTNRCGAAPAILIQAVLFGTAHYQLGMTMNEAAVRVIGIAFVGLLLGYFETPDGTARRGNRVPRDLQHDHRARHDRNAEPLIHLRWVAMPGPFARSRARVETLSDGVFAIALTLLVLSINFVQQPGNTFGDEFQQTIPQIWAYALSFAVIALFWIGHHRFFAMLRTADQTLVTLNFVYLGMVAFVPFPPRCSATTATNRAPRCSMR